VGDRPARARTSGDSAHRQPGAESGAAEGATGRGGHACGSAHSIRQSAARASPAVRAIAGLPALRRAQHHAIRALVR
jgi:hypothetical protein